MKRLSLVFLCLVLATLLSSCLQFSKEGPVDIRCPACNYQIPQH